VSFFYHGAICTWNLNKINIHRIETKKISLRKVNPENLWRIVHTKYVVAQIYECEFNEFEDTNEIFIIISHV